MKRAVSLGLMVMVMMFMTVLAAGMAQAAEVHKGHMMLKVGDEVYVCGCGEACPCKMMALKEGKCTCGKDLVKAKVTKVDKDTATLDVAGKPTVFPLMGKYACACGEACKCGSISQVAGKCVCGKDMEPVKM